MQRGVKIPGVTFTEAYCKKLRTLNDYRIDGFLAQIDHLNQEIVNVNSKVYEFCTTSNSCVNHVVDV